MRERESDKIRLAAKAIGELSATGTTNVVCPECAKKPKIVSSEYGRIIVRCPCGYVKNMQIEF